MSKNKGFYFFSDWLDTICELPDAEAVVTIRAVMKYATEKEETVLPDLAQRIVYSTIVKQMKRAEEVSEIRREAINKRWKKSELVIQNDTNEYKGVQADTNAFKGYSYSYSNISNDNDVSNSLDESLDKENLPNDNKPISNLTGESKAQSEKRRLEEAFEEFWRLYPKKKSKADAQKAWNKLKPSEERCREINEAIKRLSESEDWSRESGKFIPYPATWLNRGGWDDAERVDFTAAREPRPYNPSIDDIMPF